MTVSPCGEYFFRSDEVSIKKIAGLAGNINGNAEIKIAIENKRIFIVLSINV